MRTESSLKRLKPMTNLPSWLKTPMPLGGQIRQIREALGMTQEQLAQRSGLSQSVVAEIEGGRRRNLSLSTIQKLAGGLNSTPFIQILPQKEISKILEERSTQVAQKIVAASSGSAAIEMQFPQPEVIREQVREIKEGLLEKHRSALWRKI